VKEAALLARAPEPPRRRARRGAALGRERRLRARLRFRAAPRRRRAAAPRGRLEKVSFGTGIVRLARRLVSSRRREIVRACPGDALRAASARAFVLVVLVILLVVVSRGVLGVFNVSFAVSVILRADVLDERRVRPRGALVVAARALELELENRRALRLRDVGQERVRRAAHDGVRVRLRRAAQLRERAGGEETTRARRYRFARRK